MIVKASTHNGDYPARALEQSGFEDDVVKWMGKEIEKIGKDCFATFNETRNRYPDQFYADGNVGFEIKVSIINAPKGKKTKYHG